MLYYGKQYFYVNLCISVVILIEHIHVWTILEKVVLSLNCSVGLKEYML